MKILITGGLGHIGSYLLENIDKIKFIKKIYVIDNLSTNRYCSLFNLPKTNKNQFYVFDLIDCEVKTSKNIFLGNIINIDNFGAGDLIKIKKDNNKSFYIPMNEENVVKVDLKKKLIIVNPIKGILN